MQRPHAKAIVLGLMKHTRSLLVLALLTLTASCEMLGDAAKNINVNALLAGITDAATAQDAKPALDAAVAQLTLAVEGAKSEGEGAAGEGESMVKSVLGQFGVSNDTATAVDNLLADPAIAGVIGGTLNQLKSLIIG